MKYQIPKPAKINLERLELRNGKIIIVLKPDLLSNQVFAVNPYYDEGDSKNRLQYVDALVKFREKNGKLELTACEYNGAFYTTGNSQIYDVNSLFVEKKDIAIHEVLTIPSKCLLEDKRMDKLLFNWRHDKDFQNELRAMIDYRKDGIKKEEIEKAIQEYEEARKNLHEKMFPKKQD